MRKVNILHNALVALASLGLVLAAGTAAADDTQEAGQDLDVTMTVVSQHSSVAEDVQQEIEVPGEDAQGDHGDQAAGAQDDEHKSDTGEEHEADAADSHDGLEQAGEATDAAEHASEHADEASHDAEEASHDAEEASHEAEEAQEDANDAADQAEEHTENTAGGGGGD